VLVLSFHGLVCVTPISSGAFSLYFLVMLETLTVSLSQGVLGTWANTYLVDVLGFGNIMVAGTYLAVICIFRYLCTFT
jgi:hypothetical protein